MTGPTRIVEVAELDFAFEPTPWAFAETHGAEIAAHWAELRRTKPAVYNGRVLLLGRRELSRRADGQLKLGGAFFEANYAEFTAWQAFGYPDDKVADGFAMAAVGSADGAFLLGEMAPHTFNAGHIYFPSGTPDLSDVFDAKVDLEASVRRELMEETGLAAEDAAIRPGWTVVLSGPCVACMKAMTLPLPAEEAKARIDAFLAGDPNSEFARMHIVRGLNDVDRARTPSFVVAYLEAAFAE